MRKLNTPDLIHTIKVKLDDWLGDNNKGAFIELHNGSYRINTSHAAIRRYLDAALDYIWRTRRTTATKEELGYYTVTSSKEHSYVVVRPTSKRLPSSPGKFINWVEWDVQLIPHYSPYYINTQIELAALRWIAEDRWYGPCPFSDNLTDRIKLSNLCILSQVMLQCLFNPEGEVDLKSKPLPKKDMHCRVGSYHLLYDCLAQEWRIRRNL